MIKKTEGLLLEEVKYSTTELTFVQMMMEEEDERQRPLLLKVMVHSNFEEQLE